jgi:hypothetical protein
MSQLKKTIAAKYISVDAARQMSPLPNKKMQQRVDWKRLSLKRCSTAHATEQMPVSKCRSANGVSKWQ